MKTGKQGVGGNGGQRIEFASLCDARHRLATTLSLAKKWLTISQLRSNSSNDCTRWRITGHNPWDLMQPTKVARNLKDATSSAEVTADLHFATIDAAAGGDVEDVMVFAAKAYADHLTIGHGLADDAR